MLSNGSPLLDEPARGSSTDAQPIEVDVACKSSVFNQ